MTCNCQTCIMLSLWFLMPEPWLVSDSRHSLAVHKVVPHSSGSGIEMVVPRSSAVDGVRRGTAVHKPVHYIVGQNGARPILAVVAVLRPPFHAPASRSQSCIAGYHYCCRYHRHSAGSRRVRSAVRGYQFRGKWHSARCLRSGRWCMSAGMSLAGFPVPELTQNNGQQ
jgi:hypothetical protein